MKKKGLIITISVLLILIIASLVTKYIDTANVTTGHEPECCIKIVSQDGSKVTYWGLGYKVVRYVGVSPDEPYKNNISVKMGSWFMKYENPTNVVLDVKAFGTDNTFIILEKADVNFITNLLEKSKYIDEPCDGIANYAITYDNYTYDILVDCGEIKRGNKQAKISDKDMEELERILVNASDNNNEYKTLKIIDGAGSGNLILAGTENNSVYTLDANKVDILVNGNKAELKDLEDGMPLDVYYEGDFDNVQKPMGAVIDITSWCKSINGHSIGTERNPGGSLYDLSGLYLKVLEDLWETDAGLNGDIKYISIDLSKAPGELTEGEKAAISYIFAKAHEKQCLQLTFEELREQGFIEKDELYWENGLLFTITDSQKAEEVKIHYQRAVYDIDVNKFYKAIDDIVLTDIEDVSLTQQNGDILSLPYGMYITVNGFDGYVFITDDCKVDKYGLHHSDIPNGEYTMKFIDKAKITALFEADAYELPPLESPYARYIVYGVLLGVVVVFIIAFAIGFAVKKKRG